MKTLYDWLTVGLFCLVAMTFLQRSLGEAKRRDSMVDYLPPALGCAAANWLGNAGHEIAAIALLAASALYYWHRIKPLEDWR